MAHTAWSAIVVVAVAIVGYSLASGRRGSESIRRAIVIVRIVNHTDYDIGVARIVYRVKLHSVESIPTLRAVERTGIDLGHLRCIKKLRGAERREAGKTNPDLAVGLGSRGAAIVIVEGH